MLLFRFLLVIYRKHITRSEHVEKKNERSAWNGLRENDECSRNDAQKGSTDDDQRISPAGDLLEVEYGPEDRDGSRPDGHQRERDGLTQDTVGNEETSLCNAPHDPGNDARENTLRVEVGTVAFVGDVNDVVEHRREENARVHGVDVVKAVFRGTGIRIVWVILDVCAGNEDKTEKNAGEDRYETSDRTQRDVRWWWAWSDRCFDGHVGVDDRLLLLWTRIRVRVLHSTYAEKDNAAQTGDSHADIVEHGFLDILSY